MYLLSYTDRMPWVYTKRKQNLHQLTQDRGHRKVAHPTNQDRRPILFRVNKLLQMVCQELFRRGQAINRTYQGHSVRMGPRSASILWQSQEGRNHGFSTAKLPPESRSSTNHRCICKCYRSSAGTISEWEKKTCSFLPSYIKEFRNKLRGPRAETPWRRRYYESMEILPLW